MAKYKGNANTGTESGHLAPNQIRHQTRHILSGSDQCGPECVAEGSVGDTDVDDGPLGDESSPDARIGPVTLHPQTDGSVAVNYKHKVRSHDELGPHIKHLFKGHGHNTK